MKIDEYLQKDEFLEFSKYKKELSKSYINVFTGARGAGKTYGVCQEIRQRVTKGEIGVYLRNSVKSLPRARNYFDFLCDEGEKITLGKLGAGSICTTRGKDDHQLIGYSLYLGHQNDFKSAQIHYDYCVYEEFTDLTDIRLNRAFNLLEFVETARQINKDFKLYAIANTMYEDDLFSVNFYEKEFFHIQVHKDLQKIHKDIKNPAYRAYLSGDTLLPPLSYNLSTYKCLGFIPFFDTKIFLYDGGVDQYDRFIISDKGTDTKLGLNVDLVRCLAYAKYKNLHCRNSFEFAVGLILKSYQMLQA